ncbi:serine/threonine protein kinase PrkT [Bacillus subtilis]|uniref:protein kinase domain-containing protein n=1 Tax=Bacillus TaxID=1386 RepID=UPI001B93119A|nr:serine/threonine protein kinase PrkT [Bacillus subtilis]MDQ4712271.1 serine/threonine protein kinase PrkT [Bacillus subtilis]UHH06137.1 serine/threonine protein kinase PrkT [Bacillus subtilis]CAF1850875.1 putative serine/threonine-protein kinase YabT [Bacillus subtilis]CAI6227718.1 serine/threonine protein kinase PrkT [Bacillus subtilis]
MMNDALTSLACSLKPGTTIKGKWNGNTYTLRKQLGKGANGIVYLAETSDGHVALKVSDDSLSITSEVNVLKSFSKAQSVTMGPSFFDTDDAYIPSANTKVSFYAMEYIKGPLLLKYVSDKGAEWIPVLMIQLLSSLSVLHQQGWIFGDLKPDNLIVTGPPARIRCIDVGGTTKEGRAIKEYTEFYDRGYWGYGTRKAEPSYDLFAVAMIMINSVHKKEFKKTNQPKEQLRSLIEGNPLLQKYKKALFSALNGDYQSADEMKKDMLDAGQKASQRKQPIKASPQPATRQRQQIPRQGKITKTRYTPKQKPAKSGGLFETTLIVISVLALYFAYIIFFLI